MDRRCDAYRIAQVLKNLDADIIGLQEVDSRGSCEEDTSQMHLLAKVTGLTPVAGPTIIHRNGEYGNVLLTRLPVLESSSIDLSCHRREPRGAIHAVLDFHGQPIRVLATHLGLGMLERREQMRTLMSVIERRQDVPLILLGDMNEWFPLSPVFKILETHFGRHPTPATFPSWRPVLSLDRIIVRPKECLQRITVHRTSLTRAASDHLPVKAEIQWDGKYKGRVNG
jgi:endonuclease/exonuclease/phosphatase family metal-dependent hydrolase